MNFETLSRINASILKDYFPSPPEFLEVLGVQIDFNSKKSTALKNNDLPFGTWPCKVWTLGAFYSSVLFHMLTITPLWCFAGRSDLGPFVVFPLSGGSSLILDSILQSESVPIKLLATYLLLVPSTYVESLFKSLAV